MSIQVWADGKRVLVLTSAPAVRHIKPSVINKNIDCTSFEGAFTTRPGAIQCGQHIVVWDRWVDGCGREGPMQTDALVRSVTHTLGIDVLTAEWVTDGSAEWSTTKNPVAAGYCDLHETEMPAAITVNDIRLVWDACERAYAGRVTPDGPLIVLKVHGFFSEDEPTPQPPPEPGKPIRFREFL